MIFNVTSPNFEKEEFIKILELCSGKIAIIDNDFKVTYANKSFLNEFYNSLDDLAGKDIFSIAQMNILWKRHKKEISKSLAADEKWTGELEGDSTSLSHHLNKVTLSPLKDAENKVTGYALVAEDITHLKSAGQEKEQSQKHLTSIFHQNHLISISVDPDTGHIVDANEGACNFYGYRDFEIRRKNISEIDASKEQDLLKKLNSIATNNNSPLGQSSGHYFEHKLASGEIRYVNLFPKLIYMFDKKVLFLVIHDISDKKISELRLKESEEKYRLLFELSPDAIIVYSDGVILFANCRASSKLGMKNPLQLIGKKVLDFIHPDYIELVKQRLYTTQVKKETVPPMLYKIIKPDGEILLAEVIGAPITYEGKHAVQIVLRDVTEERKLIERAVQMQEHRQELSFPLEDKVHLETIYKPAELLSGDFYDFHKVNEDVVIGLVGDVTGKGITAALNISAMKVIFHAGVSTTNSPLELIQYMNHEVQKHLGEDYVSCCAFEMNFNTGCMRAVGAGINEFIKVSKTGTYKILVSQGPPLGMFEHINFEEVHEPFSSGDIFNFLSDGMEFIFNYDELRENSKDLVHDKLKKILEQKINLSPKLQDDCTWLSIKII
jgi:PAS domain S-box-containing protein